LSPTLLVWIQWGIDVTFGIGIVKKAQGTYRSAKKSIKHTASNRNELEYITKSIVIAKGVANHVKLNQWMPVKDPRCQWYAT
jgi:hypothetical protein